MESTTAAETKKGDRRLDSKPPASLDVLVEVAKIQSTGASNRIENISTSEGRLRELMAEKTTPRNRDEREIAAIAMY